MKQIKLLRSFVPEEVSFDSNESMDNRQWTPTFIGYVTFFQTEDQIVKVIISYNYEWGCHELSFKTVLKYKVSNLLEVELNCSYFPDTDMKLEPNRATNMFRNVVYVALSRITTFECIGFNGATPYLDRVYGRLYRLGYFGELLKKYSYSITNEGRNIFLKKVQS